MLNAFAITDKPLPVSDPWRLLLPGEPTAESVYEFEFIHKIFRPSRHHKFENWRCGSRMQLYVPCGFPKNITKTRSINIFFSDRCFSFLCRPLWLALIFIWHGGTWAIKLDAGTNENPRQRMLMFRRSVGRSEEIKDRRAQRWFRSAARLILKPWGKIHRDVMHLDAKQLSQLEVTDSRSESEAKASEF